MGRINTGTWTVVKAILVTVDESRVRGAGNRLRRVRSTKKPWKGCAVRVNQLLLLLRLARSRKPVAASSHRRQNTNYCCPNHGRNPVRVPCVVARQRYYRASAVNLDNTALSTVSIGLLNPRSLKLKNLRSVLIFFNFSCELHATRRPKNASFRNILLI